MPILLLSVILALTSAGADRDLAQSGAATQAAPASSAPTFDPDQPPSWWLDKMQRPCTATGSRVSC